MESTRELRLQLYKEMLRIGSLMQFGGFCLWSDKAIESLGLGEYPTFYRWDDRKEFYPELNHYDPSDPPDTDDRKVTWLSYSLGGTKIRVSILKCIIQDLEAEI